MLKIKDLCSFNHYINSINSMRTYRKLRDKSPNPRLYNFWQEKINQAMKDVSFLELIDKKLWKKIKDYSNK